MSAKHTPGPWSYSAQTGPAGHCFVAQVWGPDGCSLASVQTTPDPAEATANAALFAAAPKLLHFARWAQQVCDGPFPLDDINLRLAVARLAAEVIAKAEGDAR